MPYRRAGSPQRKTSLPGVVDVFRSGNVFINNVPAALWLSPGPYTSVSLPEAKTVRLTDAQKAYIKESAAAAANDPNAKEVGLSNKGDVPHEGPLTKVDTVDPRAPNATTDVNGVTTISTATTAAGTLPSDEIFATLARNIDAALAEAKSGLWRENGANPKILGAYQAVGYNIKSDSVPWCTAFTGSTLKLSGVQSLKTLSSLQYQGFGTPVPLSDKSQWRLNDIVVFRRVGGGHIGFFRGWNPQTGSVLIAGGNQSDSLTETGFRSGGMPIVYVGRAWTIPTEYNKQVTYSGSGSANVKVV